MGLQGACRDVRSSQLHGPLNNAQAADLLRHIAASASAQAREPNALAACPLYPANAKSATPEPYVAWRPRGALDSPLSEWLATPEMREHSKREAEECGSQHPDFCPSLYSPPETERVARLLHAHQNPPDCSRARFLVLTREWHSGLGSNIHVKAWMLLVAMMANRVLVDSPNVAWNMTNPANCPAQDWGCYFAPVSRCALPKDWDEAKTPEMQLSDMEEEEDGGSTDAQGRKYVKHIAHPQPLGGALRMGEGDSVRIKGFGGSRAFDAKPNSWWMTHATAYILRPNARTLEVVCWYWRCMQGEDGGGGFGGGGAVGGASAPTSKTTTQQRQDAQHQQQQQRPPRAPTASVFVRSGDKWKEASLRTAQEHFDALEAFSRAHPSLRPERVYFGTDDALVLSEVTRHHADRWNLTWIGYHRDVRGLTFEEAMTRAYSPTVELQTYVSLVDLYVSVLADIFVGTLSSNWCRLADEFRKVFGKGALPYLTPSGERLVAGV